MLVLSNLSQDIFLKGQPYSVFKIDLCKASLWVTCLSFSSHPCSFETKSQINLVSLCVHVYADECLIHTALFVSKLPLGRKDVKVISWHVDFPPLPQPAPQTLVVWQSKYDRQDKGAIPSSVVSTHIESFVYFNVLLWGHHPYHRFMFLCKTCCTHTDTPRYVLHTCDIVLKSKPSDSSASASRNW